MTLQSLSEGMYHFSPYWQDKSSDKIVAKNLDIDRAEG